MSSFFLLLSLVIVIAIVKAVLFWLYLWQLKEYRWDRFLAEYGRLGRIIRFWFFSGGRKFSQPKWTTKAILIFVASLLVIILWLLAISNKTTASPVIYL